MRQTVIAVIVLSGLWPAPALREINKQKNCRLLIAHLMIGAQMYEEFNGKLPASLTDLVEKPKGAAFWPDGGYLGGANTLPKDPWGGAFEVGTRGGLDIFSLGADGKEGGAGENVDIHSWMVFGRRCCRHLIDNLGQATKNYELDQNQYPASGNASLVAALVTVGPKKLPYFEFRKDMLNAKGEVLDPWGNPFVYKNHGVNWPGNQGDATAHNKTSFDIYSFGPDGKDDEGGGDDVNNWE